MTPSPGISGLSEIAENYDVVLCDVWGVLHNGVRAWNGAIEALSTFSSQKGAVVMITNAPRPSGPVIEQIRKIGVPEETFDGIVTSGDCTRALIEQAKGTIFHLGPDRDKTLYHGMDVEFSDVENARAVVCTGLFDDRTETPDDYKQLLASFKQDDLPFICANPDIVVEVDGKLRWCAGALARDYREIGGETLIVGKPHTPIYEQALAQAGEITGKEISKDRVLCIGDGMPTDIKGAQDNGFDVLYISAGIHAAEYGDPDHPDEGALQHFLEDQGASPIAWLPRLVW